jgi:hypothetical protein
MTQETMMNIATTVLTASIVSLFAAAAGAQNTGTIVQRNVNQQERIEKGLQSGALNTREAARLEREQAQIERMESRALKDGKLTDAEKARIKTAQDRASADIYREKHDAQTGNPNSYSSQRMQADVQRNVNQQKRIEQGYQSGQLTNREVGKLEHGQARVNQMEANAGRNGYVGPHEQRRIQAAENHQSKRIYKEKHDKQTRE